jgi:glycosyltransferase involved in cell wall biosynthesis
MMCSVFEGLPIALLEAMACGCPVITTDAGGIKEVVRHEQDGLLCPVDEPEKLADFAIDLLANDEKRKTLGRQARKRVEESFSLYTMVAELEQCYLENTEKK